MTYNPNDEYLYIGGSFTKVYQNSQTIDVGYIVRWKNYSGWNELGQSGAGNNGVDNIVRAIVYNSNDNNIYLGGDFQSSHILNTLNYIGCWNTSKNSFNKLGICGGNGVNNSVNSLVFYNNTNHLYVGGEFTKANIDGSIEHNTNHIAYVNVTTGYWSELGGSSIRNQGLNGNVNSNCLTYANGYIYIGGNFTEAYHNIFPVTTIKNIIAWDVIGTQWIALNTNNNSVNINTINSLFTFGNNSDLYINGNITIGMKSNSVCKFYNTLFPSCGIWEPITMNNNSPAFSYYSPTILLNGCIQITPNNMNTITQMNGFLFNGNTYNNIQFNKQGDAITMLWNTTLKKWIILTSSTNINFY